MSNPFAGAVYFIKGLKLLNQPSIRRYVIIPLCINIVLFSMLLWLGISYFSDLMIWLEDYMPDWLDWITWLLWPLFIISALLIGAFAFSLIANIIAAPFNSMLSTAVEKHLMGASATGSDPDYTGTMAGAIEDVRNEFKKLAYFLVWMIPFLILFLIPIVNIAAPLMWFVFTAWMLSLEYIDYPLSNRKLMFPEIKKRISEQRLAALGFGSMVNVALMVPVFNFIVMPASVAGATAYAVERIQPETNH